jgi:hypothetical protein
MSPMVRLDIVFVSYGSWTIRLDQMMKGEENVFSIDDKLILVEILNSSFEKKIQINPLPFS